MSTQTPDTEFSASRIHQTLSRSTTFWRGYTLGEAALFTVPLVVGVPILALIPTSYPGFIEVGVLGVMIASIVMLWVLHKARPSFMRLTEWITVRLRWAFKDEEYTHGDVDADTAYANRVERITTGSVIRTDGAHVGALRVRPANMALKDEESWADAIASFTSFINGSLDGNVKAKIYSPTREVSNEAFIRDHQKRLGDADVQSLPVLGQLLADFVDNHTTPDGYIDAEPTIIRDFYIIVWINDDALQMGNDEAGVLNFLASVPLLGRLVQRFHDRDMTAAEREELKAEKLQDKLRMVREGANSLYQCSGEPVTGPELGGLLTEYWSCRSVDFGDTEDVFSPAGIPHGDDGGVAATDGGTTEDKDTQSSSVEISDAPETSVEISEPEDVDVAYSDSVPGPNKEQQSVIAPSSIDWHKDYAVIDGTTYVRTFWIENFPEDPVPGLFEDILLSPELQADLSIYLDPYDSQSAVDVISDWVATLRANKEEKSNLEAEDIELDVQRAKEIRQLVRRNKTSLTKLGAFIRITADDEEELRHLTNKFETKIKDAPANCVPKRVTRRPEEGLVACSPVGPNALGSDRLSVATGEAVGKMFPFSSNYLRMEGGIEYGHHGHNGSAIHVDPWELETGHSELITGMPGAGKTHATQARGLRMLKRRDDVKQVIVDPVGGMLGTAMELDAKYQTVSGESALNPCEMHPTPNHILEQSRDMDPVTAKKEEVYGVVENFLKSRDIDLEMHSGIVTYVIDRIFEESGIDPDDPKTHTPENSPTMDDFLGVLEDLTQNPEAFADANAEAVQEKVKNYAADLRINLQPFTEGSTYENLSEESDLDVLTSDDKVVYIDLQQVEGSGDGLGRQSFIMQLLLSKIYQQAKVMDDKVEVIIDEAHYLFADDANLSFLTQIARHQRHAGLRLVLLSQWLQDFYESDEQVVEKIAGMCPIQVHHREPKLDMETARDADLTREQTEFIKQAQAGKESENYSQALVRVDEHGDYPVTITTTEFEKLIIEYDAESEDILDKLLSEDAADAEAFRDFAHTEGLGNFLDEHGLAEETIERLLTEGLTSEEVVRFLAVAVDEHGDRVDLNPDDVEGVSDPGLLDDVFSSLRAAKGQSGNGANGATDDEEEYGGWTPFPDSNGE